MSKLAKRVASAFSTKVYPNPKDPTVAAQLAAAVAEFRATYIGRIYPWVLNGVEILPDGDVDSGAFFATRDPADKSPVGYFPTYNRDLMDLGTHLPKIREAGMRFFRTTSWQERVKLLVTISEVAQERFWLLCAVKAHEQGMQVAEQIGETDEEVDFPLVNALYLERLHAPAHKLMPSPAFAGDYNGKRHIPHGVFLNICPFNFPGAIPIDMATKALANGNAIIEKSSPKSALSGYLVFETLKIAFERVGIEWRGVINYAPGGADVVDAMLQSPYVAGVSFTGSTQVLKHIRRTYGETLRHGFGSTKAPLVFGSAETSGVNPFVVCPDADPIYAAHEYVKAVVGRMGQKCSSARIAFVPDSLYNSFVLAMKLRMDLLVYGDIKKGADVGALATEADVEKIRAQIAYSVGKGKLATVLYEKPECTGVGYDFAPTILEARLDALINPSHAHEVMNTEYFAPVSTVIRYGALSDVEHLLGLSEFALTGSIFTDDADVLARLLDILPAGNAYVNRKCTGALVETECFGGLRSRSSPSGIKGFLSFCLFGSQQTISGFYPKGARKEGKCAVICSLESRGFVLSKS